MTNFESAGEFILLGDSVYYLSSPLIQYCRLDMTNLGGGKVIPHTRHGGKGNYLLGDGSVSQFGGDELIDDYLYSSYLDENGVGYGVGF
jgi:prepilin-type processing-associated H-X9-DG protein